MKFLIISLIALVIFSSVSYSMTDAEFRQTLGELKDDIQHLQSTNAQNKQDLIEKLNQFEGFVLTEMQNMFVTLDSNLDDKLDPLDFAMPVISFILVILFLYFGMLGAWYGRYYFFKRREDYYEELKKRKLEKENTEQKDTTSQHEKVIEQEGKTKSDIYQELEKERHYRRMLAKQKAQRTKGIVLTISAVFVFILILAYVIIPLISG